MLITKEQQEALINQYIKEKHNQDECIGFIDGIEAMVKLIGKIQETKEKENEEYLQQISELE